MKINVLTNNSCPNSKAFNCPILASKAYFKDKGFNIDFLWNVSGKAYDCDALLINSNVFRSFWSSDKGMIFKFLEKARSRNLRILWFDTTDSTWCTQFEVMPYVDLLLKSQIFRDRKMYLRRFRTGRIFTDFFDDLYGSGEKQESYPLPRQEDLCKIRISWNTCFENYTESRFGIPARIRQKARPILSRMFCEDLDISFTPPEGERSIKASCRLGISHSRPSVVSHRKAIMDKMEKMGVSTSKIPLPGYFYELRNSQVGIGPFGVGEITLRDFEIIICGAALLKPNMEHLETWPALFQDGKTFASHRWDLRDMEIKIQELLDNPDLRLNVALNAQNIYKDAVSANGLANFADRLMRYADGTA